jgi:predicted transcriptional regulator
VPEDESPADVFALLDDEYARAILAATSQQSMSAPTLAEVCDASRPTVYRRIDRLKNHDFVEETIRPDGDGHHRREYTATFSELSVKLIDGEFRIVVDREEHPADRFTEMWESLR